MQVYAMVNGGGFRKNSFQINSWWVKSMTGGVTSEMWESSECGDADINCLPIKMINIES